MQQLPDQPTPEDEKSMEEITDTDWVDGEYLYRDPDYVEGSHPMDTDDVTWHHHWVHPTSEQPGTVG
jgi:hypothetical protein